MTNVCMNCIIIFFSPASVNIYVHSIGQSFPFMICICSNHQSLVQNSLATCWDSVGCREVKCCLPWSHNLSLLTSKFVIRSYTPLFLMMWKKTQIRRPMFIRSLSPPVTPTKNQAAIQLFTFWNPDGLSIEQLHDLPPRIQAFDVVRMIWRVPMQSVVWS